MKDFIKLIKLAKSGDEEAMLEIIGSFTPVVMKYTRLMNYDEDFKSDMILKLIRFVRLEFDPDKLREPNNYVMVKYINDMMHHQYILLSKARDRRRAEVCCEDDFITGLFDAGSPAHAGLPDGLIRDIVRDVLTEKEFRCIDMIIFRGYGAAELASLLGISRQAVNNCKNRALNKLKQLLL